jgi:hypothetical protein
MAFLSGAVAGVLSGMGIGGGMILVPMLSFFLGVNQKAAQSVNLFFFLPTACAALFVHIKNKNVEYKKSLYMILSGVPSSILGAYIALRISNGILRKIFGVFLAVFGIIEIYACLQNKKNNV